MQSSQSNTSINYLVQIITTSLLVNNIKQRLGTKPTCPRTPHSLVCNVGILLRDLDGLNALAARRCIGHQLRMAALLQTHEPENGGLDGLANGEQAVVYE